MAYSIKRHKVCIMFASEEAEEFSSTVIQKAVGCDDRLARRLHVGGCKKIQSSQSQQRQPFSSGEERTRGGQVLSGDDDDAISTTYGPSGGGPPTQTIG